MNKKQNTIIVVAYPDRGAGKPLGLGFHHQGSTLLHWKLWEYNDLPWPRRSALSECF